ncbi:MAG: DUF1697 domain-containing protein [Candidatus Saccharimonadales bacterium]
MTELKKCFEAIRFDNVNTYINSGNVIFETAETDKSTLIKQAEEAIEKQFGFRVVCAVIAAKELVEALANAPVWWGKDADSKHSAALAIAKLSAPKLISR